MATSSIFADVKIEDAETAERFITALEVAEKASRDTPHPSGFHLVTDKTKIHGLFLKWKRANG